LVLAALVGALGIWAHAAVAQQGAKTEAQGLPAAKVGDDVISLEEVQQGVKSQLARLDQQRHAILEQRLEQMIGDRLLAQEAKRRGISTEDLLKREVYAKAPEVGDAEVSAFINQNKGRLPKLEESELRLKVWDHLRSQKVVQQRQAYVQTLRDQGQVTVYLAAPVGERHAVSPDRGFVKGSKDAPVAIVEFSDFQCPFCRNVNATLRQVMERYPGKVKLVFRDYPLAQLHPGAPKAHEAARCAAEQGKFWEYHDVLFERSPRHSPDELKQYAQDLKLDGAAFAQCLDSGRQAAEVGKDLEEGARLGVTGTPSFFINGRSLEGAQPFTAFQKLIDSELQQKAAR
jgi:protein-disulfide isomerase